MDHNAERQVDSPALATADTERARELEHMARRFGTPLLVIDERRLRAVMRRFVRAFARQGWRYEVVYAAKALALKAIARIAGDEGLMLDVCSEGELQTALQAGVAPKRCMLHGCAKTQRELALAVDEGVGLVVLDHQGEIGALAHEAKRAGASAGVLVRVNVGVAAATKAQIQTSAPESKFGFALDDGQAMAAIRGVREHPNLDFRGVHCHIGSQISDLSAYSRAVQRLADFAIGLTRDYGIPCPVLNAGGGLAIPSDDDDATAPAPEAWANAIYAVLERAFPDPGARPQLMVEPGRAIVARSGSTLYTIVVRKMLPNGSTALIVDGGMSDNPRPALYEATYPVELLAGERENALERATIFGRHCETDLLFRDVALPAPQAGDVLEVRNTGAYTYSMASNYNRFPRPAVVLVDGTRARVIAKREPLEHLLDLDVVDDVGAAEAAS